jgi:hypothetical protein
VSSHLDALYKRTPKHLWVEDPETRVWLDTVWLGQAPTISVLVAGGRASVEAMCEQAIAIGAPNVFGLVDQDFGSTNRPRWAGLAGVERVYRLDVHEIENFVLDHVALASCSLNTGRRVAADLEERILAAARGRAWWLSCARFLADTSKVATAGYPSVPGTVASLADAESYISTSAWFATTAAQCPPLAAPGAITAGLTRAHADANAALRDGSWRVAFPGKELFRSVSGYVYQNAPGPTARLDLIRSVGEWQLANNVVPVQATELRAAILAR